MRVWNIEERLLKEKVEELRIHFIMGIICIFLGGTDKMDSVVTKEDMERARKLANQHWEYLSNRIGLFYKDAFVHGYKHAVEDMRRDLLDSKN